RDRFVADAPGEVRFEIVAAAARGGFVGKGLGLAVGRWRDLVRDWWPEAAQWSQYLFPCLQVAVVAEHNGRRGRGRPRVDQSGYRVALVGNRCCEVTVERQRFLCLGEWVQHRPSQQWPDRMQPVLKRADNSEIAAAAAQPPKQFRVLLGTCRHHHALGGNKVDREKIVANQPVFSGEPTKTTAQRQPADTGMRDRAAGGGQAEGLGLSIELAPGGAAVS